MPFGLPRELPEAPFLNWLARAHDSGAEAGLLADNKLALNAGWDEQMLAEELSFLLDADLGFDVGVTRFSIPEIDALVEGLTPEEPGDPEDDVVSVSAPARCAPGDIWQLGAHRLICGDALHPAVVAALMDGERARMAFTDPPYNVPIDGHVGGRMKHREFAMASGEMTSSEFTAFLESAFRNLADHSVDGSIHFVCMDLRHVTEVMAAGAAAFTELKNLIVWAKDNSGMGTVYRSRNELIFAFKNGDAAHINTFEFGQNGRYRTNVWQHRGVNTVPAHSAAFNTAAGVMSPQTNCSEWCCPDRSTRGS